MTEALARREMTRREITIQSFLKESTYFRISSPLFSALAKSCAQDEDIVDLCSSIRRGQSAGALLPFVVQYLLRSSLESSLARYFPSVTDSPLPPAEAFPAFREFCLDRRSQIMELLSWRTVNTNLAEKACSLLPAIKHVAGLSNEPLTLLEICCSAGLNLLFDQYHYDYGSAGSLGDEQSAVQLTCKVVGRHRPPVSAMPTVAQRVGVDLVAVDVSDPQERLWMESVLCPEWTTERKRLRAALSIRATQNLRIIIGDALQALPALLDELPGSLCILQSYCMGHWAEDAKVALEELLLNTSRHRHIHRLAIDMPESEPAQLARQRLVKLASAGIPLLQKNGTSQIEHTWYADGSATTTLLGQGDIFGAWLDWQVQS